MARVCFGTLCMLAALSGNALALEAIGTLKSVDAARKIVIVFAGGRDRTLTADKNLKVLDEKGKNLPDGLSSTALKAGVKVTVTVQRENRELILKQLRLGGASPQRRPGGNDPRRTSGDTVGFKPLDEMTAEEKYLGEEGGLYGNGMNVPPAEHQVAAKKATAQIVPRGRDGQPAEDGTIALISISMSNWTQEFSAFAG